jgi:Flp pilus assembly protein TadG
MRAERLRRDERGAALVELAFALPVLLLIVWGIIDFGRLLITANQLASAVREGARYAAILPPPMSNADITAVKQVVKNRFVPLGGAALTDGNIQVNAVTGASGTVTVTITGYTWRTITPLGAMTGIGATNTLTRSATFRWEQSGP